MTEKKKAVGAYAAELQQKEQETRDPIEIQREVHKDYEKHFMEALDTGKKNYPGDFFIVVTTKMERLMQNVIRNYFFPRQSCPTPEYDQAVYRYDRQSEMVEFLWVLPAKDVCEHLRINALMVAPEERELLFFVLSFYDGTLMVKAKKLNNELADSPLLNNKEGNAWKKIKTH